MPTELPKREVEAAWEAVTRAVAVRKYHRRRTKPGSTSRETDIAVALERIQRAMRTLRTHISRFPYGPQTPEAEANRQSIRDASAALQRERRKLWKLSRRHVAS